MAKRAAEVAPASDHLVVNLDLEISRRDASEVEVLAPQENSLARRLSAVARGVLESLAHGAILIAPGLVQRMAEALGRTPSDEEIVENFEKGLQRKGGRISVTIDIDPAYTAAIEEHARLRGISIEEVLRDNLAYAAEQGWLWDVFPPLERVVMTPGMKEELVELMGQDFWNGTQLAEIWKAQVGSSILGV